MKKNKLLGFTRKILAGKSIISRSGTMMYNASILQYKRILKALPVSNGKDTEI